MQFKQYPSYKNSGVEWLGDVPEHWEVKKIKRISSVKRGASPRPINDLKYFDDNGEYAWVRISDVTRSNGFLFETEQRLSSLGASFSVKLEPESLFLSIAATVGKPCITKIKTCIHDGFVYFPKLNKHRDLLFNIFESKLCFVGLGKLGTQLNLNSETVEDIYVAIPPESEEKAILGYIQTETTRIDNLIAKQEKLIELLEEQRKSIISHAVTKGLNPNAPMKDSGVEWLGEVPEHWIISRVKFNFRNLDSKRIPLTSEERSYRQGVYPYYGASGIIDYVNSFIFEEDLVLFSEDGANLAYRSMPIAFVAKGKYWVNNHAHILKPFDNLTAYWACVLESVDVNLSITGATQPKITAENLGNICISFPPSFEERLSINNYILEESLKIDTLILKQNQLIEKLKEYRASIISHAVTGKIDVREFGA